MVEHQPSKLDVASSSLVARFLEMSRTVERAANASVLV